MRWLHNALVDLLLSVDPDVLRTTLRYFFSAVFQGMAALLGLWGIFALYVLEVMERARDRLEGAISRVGLNQSYVASDYAKGGWIEVARREIGHKGVPDWKKRILESAVKQGDSITSQREKVIREARTVLIRATCILAMSAVCLLAVGWYSVLDHVLVPVAAAELVALVAFLLHVAYSVPRLLRSATVPDRERSETE